MLKSFIQFLSEEKRGSLASSGTSAEDHIKRYIEPHIGSNEFSHVTSKDWYDLPKGSSVKMTKKPVEIEGKYYAHVADQNDNNHLIPLSRLHKPGEIPKNKGTEYESEFIEKRMKKHGLMPSHLSGAGSSSGTDFVVENRKTDELHPATVNGNFLKGEAKKGHTANMGQITIHFHPKRGWHIPDDARANRPEFAKAIEKAGIIKHMNKHYAYPEGQRTTKSGRAETLSFKHPNLEPAEKYLTDHGAQVLQVGGYGTYSVGQKDVTGHGLPRISGKGIFDVREKQKGNKYARTVAFKIDGVNGLKTSHVDLDRDEDLHAFRKTLGHKD